MIRPFLPSGGTAVLVGSPKAGKSWLALGLAQALGAQAPSWLGFPIQRHGRTLYLQLDPPRGLFQEEYLRPLLSAGFSLDEVFFEDPETLNHPPLFDIRHPEEQQTLSRLLDEIQPLLLVVDVLREIHGADENDSGSMRGVITTLLSLTRPRGVAVLLLAHPRKEIPDRPDSLIDSIRGSSYFVGKVDCLLQITPKSLIYKGRVAPLTTLQLCRPFPAPLGLWERFQDAKVSAGKALLQNGLSQRDAARRLLELFPSLQTEERARNFVRSLGGLT